jgi:hypothetical protein
MIMESRSQIGYLNHNCFPKAMVSRIRRNSDVFVAGKRLWLWIDTWLKNLQHEASLPFTQVTIGTYFSIELLAAVLVIVVVVIVITA